MGEDSRTCEGQELWRLAEELTIVQCALLLLGLDPQKHEYVERWDHSEWPEGYVAARDSLSSALVRGSVQGKVIQKTRTVPVPDDILATTEEQIPGSVDPEQSKIEVESLIDWLDRRGARQGFFIPAQGSSEPYLDPMHERYAPKLAAAVMAWKSVGKTLSAKQSPKQQILKWLRENAAKFGLSNDDGKPNERGIEEVAKVTNWAPGGGAPKSQED